MMLEGGQAKIAPWGGTKLLRPGIEPGSSACEALVLTDIRTKLYIQQPNNANTYSKL